MAKMETYSRDLDYTYAPGLFPSMEALHTQPQNVYRMLLHSKSIPSQAQSELEALCLRHGIRTEVADRALSRISGKDNVFAAAVVKKESRELSAQANHLVLHQPGDKGNVGTILRTALGFGYLDVAIIRPAADPWDPQTVRASMGALFSLRLCEYDSFEVYLTHHQHRTFYPFMLQGSVTLAKAAASAANPHSLIFGNEGSGLPQTFAGLGMPVRIPHSNAIDSLNLSIAAALAMYAFSSPPAGL